MIQALSSTPSGVLMVRNSGRGRLSPATFAVRDPLSASVRTTLPSARRRACTGGTPAYEGGGAVEQMHLLVPVPLAFEQELLAPRDPARLVSIHPGGVRVGHDGAGRPAGRVREQQVEPVLMTVQTAEPDLVP